MHLVTLLLPLARRDGSPQPRALFADLRRQCVERFGGVTFFSRAPAEGLWEDDGGDVEKDLVVLVEVVDERLDRGWWANFRRKLEKDFDQDEILIRAAPIERL